MTTLHWRPSYHVNNTMGVFYKAVDVFLYLSFYYLQVLPDENWVEVKLERREEVKLDAGGDEDAGRRVASRHGWHLHEGLSQEFVERHFEQRSVSKSSNYFKNY